MPRTSKLTEALLSALEEVLADDYAPLIFTDEELLLLVNEKLPERNQIGLRTFERFKAANLKDEEEHISTRLSAFQQHIKMARLRQKYALLSGLLSGEGNVTVMKWAAERKFIEWSGKVNSDMIDHPPVQLTIMPYSMAVDGSADS